MPPSWLHPNIGILPGVIVPVFIEFTGLDFPQQEVTFWIDSMTVGFWIRGQSQQYKPFVGHRVGEIHEETNAAQWYVRTASNPADHGTRGLAVTEVKDSKLWWDGPEFLKEPQNKWPKEKFNEPKAAVLEEIKPEHKGGAVCLQINQVDEGKDWRLNLLRFSKWYRSEMK